MMLLFLKSNSTPFARHNLPRYFGVYSNVNLRVAKLILSPDTSDYVFFYLDNSNPLNVFIGI